MKNLRHFTVALTTAALLVLSACGGGASGDSASTDQDLTVKLQTIPGQVNLPELADALGYLEPEGITLDRVGEVQGGPADIQAAATGSVDIGTAFTGSVLNLIASGAKVKAVVGNTGTNETNNTTFYTLEGSPITAARDLIGKKVAVNTRGAAQEAILFEWLAAEGLTKDEINKVELVVLPLPSAEQALREKQVDAAALSVAFQFQALERGGITQLVSDLDVYGEYTTGVYILRDDFLAKNPEKAKALTTALGKAADYIQKTDAKEVVKIYSDYLTEHGRAPDAEPLASWQGTGLTAAFGTLSAADFEPWLNWLETFGDVEPGSIDVADVFTNEFNENAAS